METGHGQGSLGMDKTGFRTLNMADRNRIRGQAIGALKEAGYDEGAMRLDESFVLATAEGELCIPIEILVCLDQEAALLVKCVRGHLSTRERAAVALARLMGGERPIPYAIVANETDAAVFDTITGKAVGTGYRAFPGPREAAEGLRRASEVRITSGRKRREERILHTYYHLRCSVDLEPY